MRKFKNLIFLFIFLITSPVVFFACGELSFDQVPYSDSERTAEEVVADINSLRTYMITRLDLKVKLEQTNTYSFYETTDESVVNKTVRDVISVSIDQASSNPMVTEVQTTRYINNKKEYTETRTYVKTEKYDQTTTSYCYVKLENPNLEETTTKVRETFVANYYDSLRFFNTYVIECKTGEIGSVREKSFDGNDYYLLTSSTTASLKALKKRFIVNKDLQENPNLFEFLENSYDSVMQYSYEYAKNGSGYLTHLNINYNVYNKDREKYLTVNSATKLTKFGDNVGEIKVPTDIDDYTANSFIKDMNTTNSYISYNSVPDQDNFYTTTTVVRLGEENPNFSIVVENHDGNVANSKYYFAIYDQDDEEYKIYSLNNEDRTYSLSTDYELELLNFDFTLAFYTKSNDYYQYGNANSYIRVGFRANEVSYLMTYHQSSELRLLVNSYGINTSGSNLNGLNLVLSLDDYTGV